MDYEDMIEDDAEPSAGDEPIVDTVEADDKPDRKTSPWKAFILTGLLSGLIGVGGGAFGVYSALTPQQISDDAYDFTGEMNGIIVPLNQKIDRLEKRLASAESKVLEVGKLESPKAELADFAARLETLETDFLASNIGDRLAEISAEHVEATDARISALEATANAEIDPAAITALKSTQADGFEWPDTSALEDRLTVLETQMEDTAEATSGDAAALSAVSLDVMDRLDALETNFQAVETQTGNPLSAMDSERAERIEARLTALETRDPIAPKIERISVLAFPKAALINAIEDNAEGGFMKKALSKHVRVKDEDNPLTLIEGIEADIAEGRLGAAVRKFDRLPAPVKAAGQAWYNSVKVSL